MKLVAVLTMVINSIKVQREAVIITTAMIIKHM